MPQWKISCCWFVLDLALIKKKFRGLQPIKLRVWDHELGQRTGSYLPPFKWMTVSKLFHFFCSVYSFCLKLQTHTSTPYISSSFYFPPVLFISNILNNLLINFVNCLPYLNASSIQMQLDLPGPELNSIHKNSKHICGSCCWMYYVGWLGHISGYPLEILWTLQVHKDCIRKASG